MQSSSQDDLKRRHRSSQSDESKSAKKSGSSSSSTSNNNGLKTVSSSSSVSGFVSFTNQRDVANLLTNHRPQADPASPRPSSKSKALSQSPAGSGSSLVSSLSTPLVSDSSRPSQPNFATAAAAATLNGECVKSCVMTCS